MGAGAVRGNSRRGPHVRPDLTGRSGRDQTGTGCTDARAPRDPVDLHELSGEEFVHQRVYRHVLHLEDTSPWRAVAYGVRRPLVCLTGVVGGGPDRRTAGRTGSPRRSCPGTGRDRRP